AVDDSYMIDEDSALSVNVPGVLGNDSDVDGDTLTASLLAGPSHGQLTLSPNGSFTYQPGTNFNGADSFTYQATDGVTNSALATVTITVNPVNDPPSFVKGSDQSASRLAGPRTVLNWATSISSGPSDESTQALAFVVTNDNPSLFSTAPAISSLGTLTYTPDTNSTGSATVTVILQDDGGTAHGGVDSSAAQAFVITINPSNTPPTVSILSPTNGSVFVVSQIISITAD